MAEDTRSRDDRLGAESDRRCFCCSALPFASCCGPIINGERPAMTAEQLMRSRFSAYCLLDAAYLLHSWATETRPDHLVLDPQQRWISLELLEVSAGGALDGEGTVEFVARFERGPNEGAMRERSRFRRQDKRWVYLDGVARPS